MISQTQWLNWEKIEQKGELYTPRTGHAVIQMGSLIFLFGGIDEIDRQNDILQMRLEDGLWSRLKVQGTIPCARSGATSIAHLQNLYLFGGYTRKHGEYFNDLHCFTPSTNTWTKLIVKNPPQARIDHSFCRVAVSTPQQSGICLLFGGSNGFKKYNDLQEFLLDKLEWRKINTEGPSPSGRFGHSAVVDCELMYLFGGWDGTNTLNDIWVYMIKQKKWLQIEAQNPPASRYRHSAVVHNKCMYIFGGVDQSQERFGDLLELTIQTNSWRRIVLLKEGPSARSFHKCVYDSGFMYIIGGYDGQRKNDMFRINLELVQIQSDEQNLKMVYEKQQLKEKVQEVVLLSLCTPQQSAKEYQILMKSLMNNQQQHISSTKNLLKIFMQLPIRRWFYLEQKDQYTARTGHTAVTCDNSIYIFGGIDAEGNKNNDLYSLDINGFWTSIKPQGSIPSPISGARAVYFPPPRGNTESRGEILIFGGYITKDTIHCNDLYSYDIALNTWQYVPLTGESIPAKRTDHSVVKYGNFIYVFGGRGEKKQIFKDLKRLNYRQEEGWKDIRGEGAQIMARFGHVAFTYEHSMYVFGGWDGTNCLDDLFQYSYVTNIWYEIRRCLGEKPYPRYRHDVLVYKDNMYIFGGVDQSQRRFQDLFQFNFEKREWTNIQTSGCIPSPRTFHKIVNIENILFLLGGFDGERRNDLHMIIMDPKTNNRRTSIVSDLNLTEDKTPITTNIDLYIKNLNEQVKELSKKIQREEDKNLCKICFCREIDTVIMDCCHFILCFSCTTNLTSVINRYLQKQCPICRCSISRVIRTYLY